MKIRNIFLLLVLILMGVFLVINWNALATEMTVNLIYTEIQAPLGLIVVGGLGALVIVLLMYMLWQQASVAMELRAAYKESRSARAAADDAEKSRFAESNRILLERIEKLEALMTARSDETLSAVRQETARVEERLKTFGETQKKVQEESAVQVNKQLVDLEKRVLAGLPALVTAPATVTAEEAEEKADAEEAGNKKNMFSQLFKQ